MNLETLTFWWLAVNICLVLEESAKRSFLFVLIIALCYMLLFGEDGILAYIKLKRELRSNIQRIRVLEQENSRMKLELERIRNDKDYLEEMVRKKYGLIKEGEKLYRFER